MMASAARRMRKAAMGLVDPPLAGEVASRRDDGGVSPSRRGRHPSTTPFGRGPPPLAGDDLGHTPLALHDALIIAEQRREVIAHRAGLSRAARARLGQQRQDGFGRGQGIARAIGQAGAVRHAISKALTYYEPGLRAVLKPHGLLTRDPRVVERKKYGKAKARRSFQFSKR